MPIYLGAIVYKHGNLDELALLAVVTTRFYNLLTLATAFNDVLNHFSLTKELWNFEFKFVFGNKSDKVK